MRALPPKTQATKAYGRDDYEREAHEREAYALNADGPKAYRHDADKREAYSGMAYESDPYAKYRRPEDYDATVIAGARPSGMYKGRAVVYAGVISADGLKHHPKLRHGVIEHVESFDGKPLSVADYEDLPSDVPHIKPYGFKVVILGDDSSY
jgi:hypothetical protein